MMGRWREIGRGCVCPFTLKCSHKEFLKMKAIQFDRYGNPTKVLAIRDCPVPEPGNGEVRIRMLASPINPSDLLFIRGYYAGVQPSFPSKEGRYACRSIPGGKDS